MPKQHVTCRPLSAGVGGSLRLRFDREQVASLGTPAGVLGARIRDLKYGLALNHMPSGRFGANAAWLTLNVIADNLTG